MKTKFKLKGTINKIWQNAQHPTKFCFDFISPPKIYSHLTNA